MFDRTKKILSHTLNPYFTAYSARKQHKYMYQLNSFPFGLATGPLWRNLLVGLAYNAYSLFTTGSIVSEDINQLFFTEAAIEWLLCETWAHGDMMAYGGQPLEDEIKKTIYGSNGRVIELDKTEYSSAESELNLPPTALPSGAKKLLGPLEELVEE